VTLPVLCAAFAVPAYAQDQPAGRIQSVRKTILTPPTEAPVPLICRSFNLSEGCGTRLNRRDKPPAKFAGKRERMIRHADR